MLGRVYLGKKLFNLSQVTGSVFSSHAIVFRYSLEFVKRPALKKVIIYIYLLSILEVRILAFR